MFRHLFWGGAAAVVNPSFVAASAAYVGTTTNTSHSFSFTTAGSGNSKRKIFVYIARNMDIGTTDVTNVTYNGIALTKGIDIESPAGTPDACFEVWYLDHASIPANGTYTVAITMSVTARILAVALEYKDIKQGGYDELSTVQNTTAGAPCTVTLAAVPVGAMVFCFAMNSAQTNFTSVAGQNERADANEATDGMTFLVADKPDAVGGADSMVADAGTGQTNAVAACWGP